MEALKLVKRELVLEGLNCAHCAEVINEKVSKIDGIEVANLNFMNKKLTLDMLEYCNEEEVINKVIKIIDDTEPGLDIQIVEKQKNTKIEMIIGGLDCVHCAEVINEKISKIDGVEFVNLNFVNKKLNIEISKLMNEEDMINKVVKIIDDTEPGLDIQIKHKQTKFTPTKKSKHESDIDKKGLLRLLIGSMVYVYAIYQMATGFENVFSDIVFLVAYIIVGGGVLKKAAINLTKGRVFDENFLMSVATLGALMIGEFPEAVGVMLFYRFGEYLQGMAVGKSRKSIMALMEIRPDYANLKVGSKVKVVTPEEIKVGDVIIVKPGERVPLDGMVIDGISMVDTSALTGESILREVFKGEEILSGFINKNALLTIKVTKEFGESTVSKILDLVENASSKKSKTENFITKFSKYYTPIVIVCAMLIAFIPPMISSTAELSDWGYRGLIFLVVSCPCALVLSIPLSFFGGIGAASKNGILIKGSNYLEALRNVDTVVFDKTGTLTKGVFNVTKIKANEISEAQLLEYAAFAEVNSNHPIAKSIVEHYNKSIDLDKIRDYEEIVAHGIKVSYDGKYILAGNEKLMEKYNIFYSQASETGTVVYVAVNGMFKGYIVISDEIKDDSKNAIENLKLSGIKEIVMLTGDNKNVANSVAKELGIDKVYSSLLPNEKVDKLEEIYSGKTEKEKVIFVGDGINDAPVLARSDVGIAMGGLGSDAAIEAADVVLMTDEPSNISKVIEISKRTNKIVWQNIVFALGVKIIVMILGAGGVATMWEAIFADVGVALIAVLNAMRIMK